MKDRMGTFYTECDVSNPSRRERQAEAQQVLVGTESLLTWIDAATMASLGISPEKSGVLFQPANGRAVSREVGFAVIHVAGRFTIDEIVFAIPGDLQILGARTLEGLNLAVDPARKRLVAAGPLPAAALA